MEKRVLIVDDTPSLRQIIGLVLRKAGYTVVEGADGADGLSKLDGSEFHLIISDINMPNMNGIEMIGEIKKMPEYKDVPIVMLTTEPSSELKSQREALGVKLWMVKPFNPKLMLEAIKKIIT
ncbi:MAG: response regulator [Woeseiaceae bacterium]